MTNEEGFLSASDDDEFAFLSVSTEVSQSTLYPCQIVIAPGKPVANIPLALAFRPGFELMPLINYYLAKALEGGQYKRSLVKWSDELKDCQPDNVSLGFENIVSAFGFLSLGLFCSVLLFVFEKGFNSRKAVKVVYNNSFYTKSN